MVDLELKHVQHFVIDVSKKYILDITFSSDVPTVLQKDFLHALRERTNDWLACSDDPIFIMGHHDDVEIKLEKVESD